MKTATYSRLLTAAGALIMLYTRWMPVSIDGSSIVNIHLVSERQNTLLVGCALFICGIILQASLKRGAPEESENHEDEYPVRRYATTAIKTASTALESKWGGRVARLCFGLLMTYLFIEQLVVVFGWMSSDYPNIPKDSRMKMTYIAIGISSLSLIYAFKSKPLRQVIRNLLATYIAICVGVWVYESYEIGETLSLLHDENLALSAAIAMLAAIQIMPPTPTKPI